MMKHLTVVSKDAPAKADSGPIWNWPSYFKTGNPSPKQQYFWSA
ncbi:MAG TPA: hypothetical protein PLO62_00585 [Candidatus Hydrogenedentes bacterium]|nr:hypothetical protein [Candidatus Hydrogenedentota bacterium]HOS01608.1 hypothetical protein [Candidatus Hydrogenedentota bacterium]